MSEHERWEARFRPTDYLFGKEPNAFLKSQASRVHGRKTALAVADGEGRNGVWLAEQGLDVLAVDFSESALAKAQALANRRGVKLRTELADIFAWRWPQSVFDVVVAIFTQVAFPPQRAEFFLNLKRVLKPGGL